MHAALKKGPLFYKKTPPFATFLQKTPPILFPAYGPDPRPRMWGSLQRCPTPLTGF